MTRKDTATVESFFSQYSELKEKKGTILFHGGATPKGVYFLRSGYVKQYAISDTGSPVIIHLFHPGSFFPLSWVLNDDMSLYIHEAIAPVSLYRAPKEDVRLFLQTHPAVLYAVSQRLMAGLIGLRKRIETLMSDDAKKKTIGFLLYLARTIGEKEGEGVCIPIALPHREIAAWIGTTRETASLQIEALVRKDFIRYRGKHILIPDRHFLEKAMVVK